MSKQIIFDAEGRDGLKRGVDALANAVKVTLGARGRNVIIGRGFGSPTVTKDGVSVAKEIELEDPLEDMGAQMVKQVASRTNDLAGDGTTTATVLAQAIVKEGLKNVAAGANPLELKKGIDRAVEAIVIELGLQSDEIDESATKIRQIATISANNDKEIGDLIAKAFKKVGSDGVITVEESKGLDTYVDVVEGMEFNRGFLSPYFVTDAEKMVAELENPYILLYDKKLMNMKDLMPVLEPVAQTGRPFLIIAEDIDDRVIGTLVVNKLRGGLKIAAVKAPGFGDRRREILEDIAILTGGQVISDEKGVTLDNITVEWLGQANSVTIDKDNTTIVEGLGDPAKIKARKEQLKSNIENVNGEFDEEKLRERLAKLSGGVAVLYIGAASEVEMKEKKDRVDDALHATRAAVEEGIVAGGGIALLRTKDTLKTLKGETPDETTGIDIISRAIESPLRTIVDNAGGEPSVVVNKVLENEGNYGYDVKKEQYVDMVEVGIIDPKKVTRVALQNAASVAGMILTTECVLVDTTPPGDPVGMPAGIPGGLL